MKKRYYLDNLESLNDIRKIEIALARKYKNIKINKDTSILTIEDDVDDIEVRNIIEGINDSIDIVTKEANDPRREALILKNLDCANCAGKIERMAKRAFDHEMIVVDFATEKFIIESCDYHLLENLKEEVKKICDAVDDQIEVMTLEEFKKNNQNQATKIDIVDKKKFFIGLGLFIIGFIAKTILHILTCTDSETHSIYAIIVIYATYVPAYILLGGDVLTKAFKNMKNGRVFDENFLMALVTIVALCINYYDEAIFVMIFYKIGELCQSYAVNYSRKSIASLIDIKSNVANVEIGDSLVEVDVDEVVVGDVIVVKEGQRVPLDGVVVQGEAEVDNSALTGESVHIYPKVDDTVLSGSIVAKGTLKIKVIHDNSSSMVTKILDLVANASSKKSKSENFITKFAKYYTPTVVILAIILAIFTPLIAYWAGSDAYQLNWIDGYKISIRNALVFLVVSCPCALVISIPLGFFGGIGGASKNGILIKGSNYLEALNSVDTIVFDKTGTLTEGHFQVEKIVSKGSYSEEELLKIAASCESLNNHPIARSIVERFGQKNIDHKSVTSIINKNLGGIESIYDDLNILLGNYDFMNQNDIEIKDVPEDNNVIYIAINHQYEGYLVIADKIKDGAIEAINELKKYGVKNIAIITGDNQKTAKKIADQLGVNQYYHDVNPLEKVEMLEKIKANKGKNKKVVYVGDGINDAPVLSSSDVGIAMGALGSDAAIEVADVVLMSDELNKIPQAIRIARKTRRIVLENIIFALLVKIAVLVIAPLNIANYLIIEAIFADVGVSLIAILNSFRAMKVR